MISIALCSSQTKCTVQTCIVLLAWAASLDDAILEVGQAVAPFIQFVLGFDFPIVLFENAAQEHPPLPLWPMPEVIGVSIFANDFSFNFIVNESDRGSHRAVQLVCTSRRLGRLLEQMFLKLADHEQLVAAGLNIERVHTCPNTDHYRFDINLLRHVVERSHKEGLFNVV